MKTQYQIIVNNAFGGGVATTGWCDMHRGLLLSEIRRMIDERRSFTLEFRDESVEATDG